MGYSPNNTTGNGINYILAPVANTTIAGWVTYADAAGTTPVDGTGGSPSSTLTRSTSSPLASTASFLWTKSAANRQGEGFSYDFTIDNAYKGQQLAINYLFEVTSGTYVTADMTVWVYDVTNSTLIQPSGYQVVNTAVAGPVQTAVFQAASNSTSYRLILHTATTSASAYTLKFDNFSVGPQVGGYGLKAKASTIQKFTSGSGTYTTPAGVYQIKVRMVGGGAGGTGSGTAVNTGASGGATTFGTSLLVANGGGGSGAGSIGGSGGTASLGTGPKGTALTGGAGASGSYTRSAQDLSGGSGAATPFGAGGNGSMQGIAGSAAPANTGAGGGGGGMTNVAAVYSGGGGGAGGFVDAIISSPSATYAYAVGAGGAGGAAGTSGATGYAGGSGYIEVEEFYYGDNVLISDSTATRVVAAAYFISANYAVGANAAINFDSRIHDTHGAVTTGAAGVWKFTAPVPGFYRLAINGMRSTGGTIFLYKNGVKQQQLTAIVRSGENFGGQAEIQLNAGDFISVNDDSSVTIEGSALNAGTAGQIYIDQIQGPAQIQAATIVAARCETAAAQSIANLTQTIVDFGTKTFDTAGAVTTGASWKFTAPAPGFYSVSAMIMFANTTTWADSENIVLTLHKNGTVVSNLCYKMAFGTASGVFIDAQGTDLISLIAGDYIDIRIQQASGAALALHNDGKYNYVSIQRLSGVN